MLISKRHFVCSEIEKNANKYWIISLFDNGDVKTEWGRVGSTGESLTKSFSSQVKAKQFFDSKIKSKLKPKEGRRDAYTEITLAHDKAQHTSIQSRHLPDLAVEQIQTSLDEVRQLIRWLAEINIHNILASTTIKYNASDGCFSTPLGVVDKTCINTARDLLTKIVPYANANNLGDPACKKLINSYLRYIPQNLGGSHVRIKAESIFGSQSLLTNQENIIEGLEASLQTAKPEIVKEKVFDVTIDLIDPTFREEASIVYGTAYEYKIRNVYGVSIKSMDSGYTKMENDRLLLHGTNPANILSILKSGLVIRESVNGSNYGRGLYFSDKSTKSLQYANSYLRDGVYTKFMFVSRVAMGKVYYGGGCSLPEGYNSRWAEKSSSNSQIIVYNTNQVNLVYLLELVNG